MPTINLTTRYDKKLAEYFKHASYIKGRTGDRYEIKGDKAVRIFSINTVPIVDYTRSGLARYGTPTDIGDTVQEVIMTQDKAFNGIIDKGNNIEQMNIKSAAQFLRQETDERIVPTTDKYAFNKVVMNAGHYHDIASAPTVGTIVATLAAATVKLQDAHVPIGSTTLYIPNVYYNLLRLSPEFLSVDALGKKSLSTGEVGNFMGYSVVRVPSDYLPANCYALFAYKNALVFPWTLNDTKVHTDPPGVSGSLIEGRYIYDMFVLGSVAKGVLPVVQTSQIQPAPTVTASTGTIASTGATKILYTLDGSDPRFSVSAQVYTAPVGAIAAGTVVKAVAYKTDSFPSNVTAVTA